MSRTIVVSDELYTRIEALARPFVDREPQDVIRWLVESECTDTSTHEKIVHDIAPRSGPSVIRAPRERGAVVELDGETITADTVPDLCTKVMEYLDSKGQWERFEELSPYKTSTKRFLFSTTPKHPNGNDFFVPVKHRNMYMEAHKNYQTTIKQLSRLLQRMGINLVYRGS